MKFRMNRIKIISILAFILSIGPITWIVYGNEEKDITYSIKEELMEDATKAALILEITPSDRVTEVTQVILPDGSIVEKQTCIEYEVKENGEYKFVIQYRKVEENENNEIIEVAGEETIHYQVTGLVDIQEEPMEIYESNEYQQIKKEQLPETYAVESVMINETNFPDPSFLEFIKTLPGGEDGQFTANELSAITSIDCSDKEIKEVTGIHYFTALTDLNCSKNQLTILDVSANTSLINLYCFNNQLKSLDVSQNASLEILQCYINNLESLDVTNNKVLKELTCYANQLSNLDVSQNKALRILHCINNHLTELDVSNNLELTYLHCHTNPISNLDITNNKNLGNLACSNSRLVSIDLSNNNKLTEFAGGNQQREVEMHYVDGQWQSRTDIKYAITRIDNEQIHYNSVTGQFTSKNKEPSSTFTTECIDGKGIVREITGTLNFIYIIAIDESNFPDENFRKYVKTIPGGEDGEFTPSELSAITSIDCSGKEIKEVTGIHYFTALTDLNCSKNQLTILDVSANTSLINLYCFSNQLKSLNVSQNASLEILQCYINNLESLDVTNNKELKELTCYANQLSNLDVSQNKALRILHCINNHLTKLDVSNNPELLYLHCHTNPISNLDVSNNRELQSFACSSSQLLSIDLSNNAKLSDFAGGNQSRKIEMHYVSGYWQSQAGISITKIDNDNVQYDSATGQFTSKSKEPNSTFTTECVDGKGVVRKITGTLQFIYDGTEVTNITGIANSMLAGTSMNLQAKIEPENATEQDLVWSIKSAGTTGATLNGTILQAKYSGTITLLARVVRGELSKDYTQEFTITVNYGDPSQLVCSIEATTGKNGWYISDVIIKPPSGYQISNVVGEKYEDFIIYNASTTPIVYLKDSKTGILYSGKTLDAIKIDKNDPVIEGIETGKSEITDQNKIVTVKDTYLNSVLLYVADSLEGLSDATAIPQSISNGISSVTLEAANKNQYFKIVGEDLSGRNIVYTYSLITPIYKVIVDDITFETIKYGAALPKGKILTIDTNAGNIESSIISIISNDTTKFTVTKSGNDWVVLPQEGLSAGTYSTTLSITHTGGVTTSSVTMKVEKITNPFTIMQANIIYGEVIDPKISNVKEGAKITIYYKPSLAGEDQYTTEVPKVPGNYVIKAISEETENYNKTEIFTSFLIDYQLLVKDACITIDEAKEIKEVSDLKKYRQVNSNPPGAEEQISVECPNIESIQNGQVGNYGVTYTLVDISSMGKIQVVASGYQVSSDRQSAIYGKDTKITKTAAKTITKEELLKKVNISVMFSNGGIDKDKEYYFVDMTEIHKAQVGNYEVKISYQKENIKVEKVVLVDILEDNPIAMVSIPSSIKLDRVKNDTVFEAIKEESVGILETTDTEFFIQDFHIMTDTTFQLINANDIKEHFTVQIYDEDNIKHTSKDVPLAVLNGVTNTKKFYVKAYKDLAKKRGNYEGTMNFVIKYGDEK